MPHGLPFSVTANERYRSSRAIGGLECLLARPSTGARSMSYRSTRQAPMQVLDSCARSIELCTPGKAVTKLAPTMSDIVSADGINQRPLCLVSYMRCHEALDEGRPHLACFRTEPISIVVGFSTGVRQQHLCASISCKQVERRTRLPRSIHAHHTS